MTKRAISLSASLTVCIILFSWMFVVQVNSLEVSNKMMGNSTEEKYGNIDEADSTTVYDNNLNTSYSNRTSNRTMNMHQGFLHGFVESLTIILVSEIGDKSFFIAAIMSMEHNKIAVFFGATSALTLMTLLSVFLGFVITSFIPRIYTYYTCTVVMFLFGLKMLWDAYHMEPNTVKDRQDKVTNELQRKGSIASGLNQAEPPPSPDTAVVQIVEAGEQVLISNTATGDKDDTAETAVEKVPLNSGNDTVAEARADDKDVTKSKKHMKKKVQIKEEEFSVRSRRVIKVLVSCFTMTFLAEWGDPSQLAVIMLASVNDVFGVCVGGILGHVGCTVLAILAGTIFSRWMGVRVVTFVGALVFLGLAIASLFFDPEKIDVE